MTSVPTASPIYLRTDMVFGLVSGGSIAHVSGVFNHLDAYTHRPTLFTTDHIPGIRSDLEVHNILPGRAFLHDPEIAYLHNTATFEAKVLRLIRGKRIGFVYQRYSTNNFAGARLKGKLGVPLVLDRMADFALRAQHEIFGLGIVVSRFRPTSRLHKQTVMSMRRDAIPGIHPPIFNSIITEATEIAEAADIEEEVGSLRQKFGGSGPHRQFSSLADEYLRYVGG